MDNQENLENQQRQDLPENGHWIDGVLGESKLNEELLPDGNWTECDVNYEGGYRNGERLVFNREGAIYYTNDHYESFTQLYEGWAEE